MAIASIKRGRYRVEIGRDDLYQRGYKFYVWRRWGFAEIIHYGYRYETPEAAATAAAEWIRGVDHKRLKQIVRGA